jgi:hypothetical protein
METIYIVLKRKPRAVASGESFPYINSNCKTYSGNEVSGFSLLIRKMHQLINGLSLGYDWIQEMLFEVRNDSN